jgi:glycosyltransferase involved in cell wall biosynthesis
MRRVLAVVHGPVFGGGHGQLIRLAEPLARRGWELVAGTPHGAPAAARLRDEGLPVHELALHRLRRSPDPRLHAALLAGLPGEVRALRDLVRREQIAVVQPHGDTNPHLAIAGHREGRAVAWQLYDTVTPPPARRVTMPLVLRLADVVTTWGRQLGHEHPGTPTLGDRWITVFPPVDGRRFAPDPQRRAAARTELGAGPGDLVVGTVGVRNPTKGHDVLLRAVGRARRDDGRLVARVLGAPSPVHADYERRVQAAAAALGPAARVQDPGRRVPELLPGFDVFCLSSVPRSEGMPTVILEAMACGIPVVATDVGAVRELVTDGVTGLVVAPEDEDALARALLALAADPDRRAAMGAAGRERFTRDFALEVLADVYDRAYGMAVAHRAARRDRMSV